MNTKPHHIQVNGIVVEVRRKKIKNLHLRVYPPDGRVKVSAPLWLDEEAVRAFVLSRLTWIRRQQETFRKQVRPPRRELVTGERHYFQGRCCRLDVIEHNGPPTIHLTENAVLTLRVRPGTDPEERQALLYGWYRERLRQQLPALLARWAPKVGVTVAEVRIKRMKTRWGTCNIRARRIWVNLHLAERPVACLEYVLVHEMVHLLERYHNDRFKALMDQFLPSWRLHKAELNRAPLADEPWRR